MSTRRDGDGAKWGSAFAQRIVGQIGFVQQAAGRTAFVQQAAAQSICATACGTDEGRGPDQASGVRRTACGTLSDSPVSQLPRIAYALLHPRSVRLEKVSPQARQ